MIVQFRAGLFMWYRTSRVKQQCDQLTRKQTKNKNKNKTKQNKTKQKTKKEKKEEK